MYHTPTWYSELRDVGLLWQALAGVVLFWSALPKRAHHRILCAAFALVGGLLLYLSRQMGLLLLAHGSNVYIVYLLCAALVRVCCPVSLWTAWMIGATGYLAQQTCGSLELAFRAIPGIDRCLAFQNSIVLLDVAFYSAGYWILWRIFRNNNYREDMEFSTLQKIMFSLLATLFSLGFYTVNQYVRGWEGLTWIEIVTNALYMAMGGIFLLLAQYGMIRSQKINAENHVMQTLLYAQSSQWQASREHTELVNEKYHDLKKYLNTFRGKVDPAQLEALAEVVDAYDDHVTTGNQVADVVLTEGRELCRKYGIQLTCYVNGADLSFLEEMDLYSLLKNALDNAIEAVRNLPDEREKFISLTARREGALAMLHAENPCGEVRFVDDLPQTQQSADYHGYGMKSMMRVAAKYGGMLTCSEKDGVFYLDVVLFPEGKEM